MLLRLKCEKFKKWPIVVFKRKFCSVPSSGNVETLGAKYVPNAIENIPLNDELFKPKIAANKSSEEKRVRMILPPPNITGTLHLGHALTTTIQDVIVKWNKLRGVDTLWIPGTDHAGIATQVIVEKKLWSERKQTRHDIGRDAFNNEVIKWKDEKTLIIRNQLKRLGASLDWNKEFFTMDKTQSSAVIEAFVKLYESGYVYQDNSLVNWSCVLRSAISDIEVDYLDINGTTDVELPGIDGAVEFGTLTKFAYKLDSGDEEIIVATTRPETMLGDVAIAVHPNDGRYTKYIGRFVKHPFTNKSLPVIQDEFVDPDFGTGAVKITPAHDPVDFEVAKRHRLTPISVINDDGTITWEDANNLHRFKVRRKIIDALHSYDLHRGSESHTMRIPICSRSKDVVEFLLKPQWFIKCKEMADKAILDVREKRLTISPENFERNWFDWLENIRDWCVSRQLWWGHRIPIYYCECKGGHGVYKTAARNLSEAKVKAAEYFRSEEVTVRQEEDVLDTWFSSGLLPFTTTSGDDPLTLMETGHDILFFWVARMVMLGDKLTGRLPFNKILLHGIVCDSQGRKMSKSLGNVIAPEDVIEGRSLQELREACKKSLLNESEYQEAIKGQKIMFPDGIPECGVDALRFTLCSYNIRSHFINFDIRECNTNKLFGNKIWQATKFTLKWCETLLSPQNENTTDDLTLTDQWMLSKLSEMIKCVNESMKHEEFHVTTAALKKCIYYEFCDIYLETCKKSLFAQNATAVNHCKVLLTVLDESLYNLAPFMPFLSQHLYEHITHLSQRFNLNDRIIKNELIETEFEEVLQVVSAIRRLKNIFKLAGRIPVEIITSDAKHAKYYDVIHDLSNLSTLRISETPQIVNGDFITDSVNGNVSIRLCMPENWRASLNLNADKLQNKRAKLLKDLEKIKRNMATEGYKNKVVGTEHENYVKKVSELEEKITRIDYIQKYSR